MEALVGLFIIIVIIGALVGGKSFGGTIARGIGCLVMLFFGIALALHPYKGNCVVLCINAPESDQSHGSDARRHLAELVDGKTVRVEGDKIDGYGRMLVKLYHDESKTSANWRMVRNGYAWEYDRHVTCGADYQRAEREARAAGAGLWSEPDPTPPWEWRQLQQ